METFFHLWQCNVLVAVLKAKTLVNWLHGRLNGCWILSLSISTKKFAAATVYVSKEKEFQEPLASQIGPLSRKWKFESHQHGKE